MGDGLIYSFVKGIFKKHDAITGEPVYEFASDANWISDSVAQPNLFQMSNSSNYVWCGFIGKGISAFDRKTGSLVWHKYDGATCNQKFKIISNFLNVQLTGSGIALENTSKQEILLIDEEGLERF